MNDSKDIKSELIVLLHEIKQLLEEGSWARMNEKIWLLHHAYNTILIEIAMHRNIDPFNMFIIAKERATAIRLQGEIYRAKVELLSVQGDSPRIKFKLYQAHLKTIQAHIQHLLELS